MGRTTLSWIGMIVTAFCMITLIIIYFKKPSTDRNARRIRAVVFLILLAVFAFCAFLAFGEHGGMSFVKGLIENPMQENVKIPAPSDDDRKDGTVVVTVSGRTIDVNGYTTEDPEEFRQYLAGYGVIESVELIDDFAVSSVMHDVMDVLREEKTDWELSVIKGDL